MNWEYIETRRAENAEKEASEKEAAKARSQFSAEKVAHEARAARKERKEQAAQTDPDQYREANNTGAIRRESDLVYYQDFTCSDFGFHRGSSLNYFQSQIH